jgi:methionyl-tRNA formyltransferase
MKFRNIAVLTSKQSWFISYNEKLVNVLKKEGYKAEQFSSHRDISEDYEIVFILSYFEKIEKEYLEKHKHNLVIHESDLPQGRGWAPIFWQILEGKGRIPIVLIDASEKLDEGNIYLKDYIYLEGVELHDEIREKQANKTIELCLNFLKNYESLKAYKQKGKSTYYKKRVPNDSELNINKNIKEQFNLLRIANNEEFPVFFQYKGKKYILKIFKKDNE